MLLTFVCSFRGCWGTQKKRVSIFANGNSNGLKKCLSILTGAKIRFFLDMSKCRNKNAPLSGKILVGSLSRRNVLSPISACACVRLRDVTQKKSIPAIRNGLAKVYLIQQKWTTLCFSHLGHNPLRRDVPLPQQRVY